MIRGGRPLALSDFFGGAQLQLDAQILEVLALLVQVDDGQRMLFQPVAAELEFQAAFVRAQGQRGQTVGAAGAMLFVSVAGTHPKLFRAIANFASSIGLGAGATRWGLHILGFALFAIAGWVVLDSIRQMYRRKYLSDQSVTVGTIWFAYIGLVSLLSGARPLRPLA